MEMQRAWFAIALASVLLFAAGVVTRRMTAPDCPAGALCALGEPSAHRLHPRRATALWEASGGLAVVAFGLAVASKARRRPAPN
jgi:hypothetical protein